MEAHSDSEHKDSCLFCGAGGQRVFRNGRHGQIRRRPLRAILDNLLPDDPIPVRCAGADGLDRSGRGARSTPVH